MRVISRNMIRVMSLMAAMAIATLGWLEMETNICQTMNKYASYLLAICLVYLIGGWIVKWIWNELV